MEDDLKIQKFNIEDDPKKSRWKTTKKYIKRKTTNKFKTEDTQIKM